jgi:hypothetical protein
VRERIDRDPIAGGRLAPALNSPLTAPEAGSTLGISVTGGVSLHPVRHCGAMARKLHSYNRTMLCRRHDYGPGADACGFLQRWEAFG